MEGKEKQTFDNLTNFDEIFNVMSLMASSSL